MIIMVTAIITVILMEIATAIVIGLAIKVVIMVLNNDKKFFVNVFPAAIRAV